MHEKKSFTQRAEEFLGGKGFYIVLFVCIAVIGVSAWLLLFSEFSPLKTADDGDYLDAMAESTEVSNPIDLREDTSEEQDSDTPDDTPEDTAPENTDGDSDAGTDTDSESAATLTITSEPEDVSAPAPAEEPASEPEAEPEKATVATLKPEDISFIWPVNGSVAVEYSPDGLIYDRTMGDWRTHDGLDIAAPLGTKIMTVADGTVSQVFDDDFYGTTVVIDHGAGVMSTYSNLTGMPTVKEGDAVTMGSVIGAIGDTSLAETGEVTHVHFSMTVNGESADPAAYLPKKSY